MLPAWAKQCVNTAGSPRTNGTDHSQVQGRERGERRQRGTVPGGMTQLIPNLPLPYVIQAEAPQVAERVPVVWQTHSIEAQLSQLHKPTQTRHIVSVPFPRPRELAVVPCRPNAEAQSEARQAGQRAQHADGRLQVALTHPGDLQAAGRQRNDGSARLGSARLSSADSAGR